jgi:tetratricopeptide (TPR) repeat protein
VIAFLLLFLTACGVFALSLAGSVPAYRDSGDMINAISTLGIAHPPGYPTYVLIGKLFSVLIPLGNPAFRVNLFSATAAALTASFLYKAACRLGQGESRIPCILVACWYSLTPAVLNLARVAEMYSLAGLFAVAILACALRRSPRAIYLGSFLLAIGIGVHPTLLVLAPLLLPSEWRSADARRAIALQAGAFSLGLLILLVPMVRAWSDPVQNWGNPTSLTGLWRLLSRSNYGGLKLHPEQSHLAWTPGGVIDQLALFFDFFRSQWGWVGIILGTLGMAWGLQDRRPLTRRRVIVWLLAGPVFIVIANLPAQERTTLPILEPYFVLVNLLWALWIAEFVIRLTTRAGFSNFRWALLAGLALLPVFRVSAAWQSYRNDFYAVDLVRNIQRSLPPGAVLVDPDDPIAFSLRYLQLAENRRTDLVPLNFFRTRWGYEQIMRRWPDLLPPVAVHDARELDRYLWYYSIRRRPLFVDLPLKIPATHHYLSQGIVYRVLAEDRAMSDGELALAEDLLEIASWRGSWRLSDHPDFFTRQVLNYRAAAECNLGLKYAERQLWAPARVHYLRALVLDPQLAPGYNDLGVLYYSQHQYVAAADAYRLALRFEPGNPGYQRNLELALDAQRPAR